MPKQSQEWITQLSQGVPSLFKRLLGFITQLSWGVHKFDLGELPLGRKSMDITFTPKPF
ncbi:hypothetical protein GLOIN_2v1776117 [Rhizophagus irregularis DAOM 181602=DAOM 197198]|uniref:Uncharacterized protein n=1 Tax=Rhizophagus irregularis (strain DAOM 181602 / DAOM 197198 / MUCL 43194) TaxID=747089 RepID=A0A2P4PXT7_RHIID|nr:hypothetical protein GLOIN_2v1776117 [Rhizophagus irregularis DAOM 181602=DAOM 197198]POG70204.1 hypothetical protein GLOIN_2v1776117 [Rhizophagus irregularis DAOM 181602=DAOM 197198]GET61045.1 hypothetical protein GLOIN_2v1776117 [Rhizophagus irregularis DAOM 181602=DAOM 197198]|eukprot:XP_025177070.1 hypothetical protein GLOIN_2v1776117 [Rhizophagus irregularis DAOM 181602=DAOM 197198]